ncbi:sulfate adenylyltransferase [Thiohalorhabdus methylotrophus]|uniref:Sulfate adenylyltransferase n=1 Tax=Thiohalorhabdus methylotrophus TaxID=3242694 RepID=A0ABV4TWL0_9GAMM
MRTANPLPEVPPHGGRLVNRLLSGAEAEEARAQAAALPAVSLSSRALADLECLATGVYSPLEGFMDGSDFQAVVSGMQLAGGEPWTVPVTLPVGDAVAGWVKPGSRLALQWQGAPLGVLEVSDCFRPDKEEEAVQVFGTGDADHPGVAALYEGEDFRLGGTVWAWDLPRQDPFAPYRWTPAAVRKAIADRGWRSTAAFQTRNPIHRAHEHLQKVALEVVDGLLVHPLVGTTKQGDIPPEVRLDTYEAVLSHYYPRERTLLTVFPAAMRYAGPREAVMHAIARKNYGCTHFIVGRDHAGVGDYYGTYEAQEIFDRFSLDDLGIQPLKFDHAFFCRACDQMASIRTCPHSTEERVVLSGTEVRRMLRDGEHPPPEFTRPEVAEILVDAFQESGAQRA